MKKKIRGILLTVLSLIGIVFSIIFYVKSIVKIDYGTGIDYSCDYDYVIVFIIFLIIFILGLYELINTLKNKESKDYSFLATTIILALGAAYPLSVFFKALSKGDFDFYKNQFYLYIGIASLILLIGCYIYYKVKKKK